MVRSPVPRYAFLAQPLRFWVDVGWKFPDEADVFCCDSLCTALLKLSDSGREPGQKIVPSSISPFICLYWAELAALVGDTVSKLCETSNSRSKALSERRRQRQRDVQCGYLDRRPGRVTAAGCCRTTAICGLPCLSRSVDSCVFDVSSFCFISKLSPQYPCIKLALVA